MQNLANTAYFLKGSENTQGHGSYCVLIYLTIPLHQSMFNSNQHIVTTHLWIHNLQQNNAVPYSEN